MKKIIAIIGITITTLVPAVLFARTQPLEQVVDSNVERIQDALSSFRQKISVPDLSVVVPTVVEVDITNKKIERPIFAVYNKTKSTFVHSLFVQSHAPVKAPTISVIGGASESSMSDSSYQTFVDFALPTTGQGEVTLRAVYDEPITTDTLEIGLDAHVALPVEVSVSAISSSGDSRILVNRLKPSNSFISFPKVTEQIFEISLIYTQPLRISEVYFADRGTYKDLNSSVRFLMYPDSVYEIFLNPDRGVVVPVGGESPNLTIIDGVKKTNATVVVGNDLYSKPDVDTDGILDEVDNCVLISNIDQADIDTNGRGDACDDFDTDGILNHVDNCVEYPNRTQVDIDSDGIGDVCDPDESRITERYPVLVWGGIIFAVVVFIALYFTAVRSMRAKNDKDPVINDTDIIGR